MNDQAYNKYEVWCEQRLKRYPELVEELQKALQAFKATINRTEIEPEELAPIVDLVRSSRTPLFVSGAEFFHYLLPKLSSAAEALRELSKAKKAHIRHNAILCINSQTPKEISIEVLSRALTDNSLKVREKAADWALRIRLKEIIPDLEKALSLEPKTQTKRRIKLYLELLRDGYSLGQEDNGTVPLTVLKTGSISPTSVTMTEIEERGIEAIVSDIRERCPFSKLKV